MKSPKHKKELMENLQAYLNRDPVKGTVVDMTSLNIVEVTRKKCGSLLQKKWKNWQRRLYLERKVPADHLVLYWKPGTVSDAAPGFKENDVNKDKWIGVGGHFEANESPEECLLREVLRNRTDAHFLPFSRIGYLSSGKNRRRFFRNRVHVPVYGRCIRRWNHWMWGRRTGMGG